jgi:sodium pump decarboxylase gamma subunit
MKKLFTLLCMIACIFLLPSTARAQEAALDYGQQKVDAAQQMADNVMTVVTTFIDNPELLLQMNEYTAEELEYVLSSSFQVTADGNVFKTAVSSFQSATEDMGAISEWSIASAEADGDSIIVLMNVTGAKENAQAEIIISNDFFLRLESATLNPASNMGARMVTAAMNTAIGLTTVFTVLIIIILLISCFTLIPKIQASFSKKKEVFETAEPVAEIIPAAAAAPAAEESYEEEIEDGELVAVIAAAIAASEGMVSPEELVVRSIRRVKRA